MSWNPDEHYKSSKVANGYDQARFSSLAGRVFNYLEKRTIVRCFSTLPKQALIVDVPCGTGRLAEPLLAVGYRVHAVDISGAMLEVAQDRLRDYGDRFSFQVADVKSYHSSEPQYDAALCARVLMHFPLDQQIEFLAGVTSLSRSIVVINHSLSSPYQRIRRRVKRWLGNQAPANFPVTNAEIKVLLEMSGLREVGRCRLVSLVSEAIYIIAKRADVVATQASSAEHRA